MNLAQKQSQLSFIQIDPIGQLVKMEIGLKILKRILRKLNTIASKQLFHFNYFKRNLSKCWCEYRATIGLHFSTSKRIFQ